MKYEGRDRECQGLFREVLLQRKRNETKAGGGWEGKGGPSFLLFLK